MLDAIQSIASAFSHDVDRAARSAKRDALLLAFAALFGLTAYVGAIAAGSIYAAALYGAVAAAIVVCLAAILAMLIVIAALRYMQLQDRKAARRADARIRMVSHLGTAVLPILLNSKATSTAALIGGAALLAKELLRVAPEHTRKRAIRRRRSPTVPPRVNGAMNPYLHAQEQETLR